MIGDGREGRNPQILGSGVPISIYDDDCEKAFDLYNKDGYYYLWKCIYQLL